MPHVDGLGRQTDIVERHIKRQQMIQRPGHRQRHADCQKRRELSQIMLPPLQIPEERHDKNQRHTGNEQRSGQLGRHSCPQRQRHAQNIPHAACALPAHGKEDAGQNAQDGKDIVIERRPQNPQRRLKGHRQRTGAHAPFVKAQKAHQVHCHQWACGGKQKCYHLQIFQSHALRHLQPQVQPHESRLNQMVQRRIVKYAISLHARVHKGQCAVFHNPGNIAQMAVRFCLTAEIRAVGSQVVPAEVVWQSQDETQSHQKPTCQNQRRTGALRPAPARPKPEGQTQPCNRKHGTGGIHRQSS